MLMFIFQPVPITWALLQNKKWESYMIVFLHLKENFQNFQICELIGDFDRAMKKASVTVFPEAKILDCNFDYAQVCNK